MIAGFGDSQGLSGPVNGGVCNMEPGEPEDDVLSATTHDIEEVLLGNPFDVHAKGTSIMDYTSFVYGPVNILDCNRAGEFLGEELIFPDELSVNVGDVSAGVYQCRGVDNF